MTGKKLGYDMYACFACTALKRTRTAASQPVCPFRIAKGKASAENCSDLENEKSPCIVFDSLTLFNISFYCFAIIFRIT